MDGEKGIKKAARNFLQLIKEFRSLYFIATGNSTFSHCNTIPFLFTT